MWYRGLFPLSRYFFSCLNVPSSSHACVLSSFFSPTVIAVIAATLFPLWPAEMRVGVYYLSVGAGCFVASILLLAVGKCASFSFSSPVCAVL